MVVGAPQSWEADARDAGKTSLAVLLEWLTQPGNYARWRRAGKKRGRHARGEDENGGEGDPSAGRRSTRASLLHEIVALLHSHGLTHREERDVRSKMHDLEKSFWDTVAWKTTYEADGGSGRPMRRGPPLDFHDELLKRCKHFETLAPALLAETTPPRPAPAAPPAPQKTRSSTSSSDARAAPSSSPTPSSLAPVAGRAQLNDDDVLLLTNVSDRKPWGADAMDHGMTSMDVLLDWLSAPTNYARWHSDAPARNKGAKVRGYKEILLREIVDEMKCHGLAHRTTRDVRTKINEIERSVRAAIAWRDKHGEDILNRYGDGEAVLALDEIRTGMVSVCKYFDRIGPAMVPLLFCSGTRALRPEQDEEEEERSKEPTPPPPASDGLAAYDHDVSDRESRHENDDEQDESQNQAREQPRREGESDDQAERSSESPGAGYGYSGRSFVPILPRTAAITAMTAAPQSQTTETTVENHQVPDHGTVEDRVITEREATLDPDEPLRKKSKQQRSLAVAQDTAGPQQTTPRSRTDVDIQDVQRQVELDKLYHERRCHELQEERLQLEVARQQIHVNKEKALARHELRQAGVPEDEINLVFPLG
jgi:hypothetical protein